MFLLLKKDNTMINTWMKPGLQMKLNIDLFSQNYTLVIITPLKTAVGSVIVSVYENSCWHGTLKSPHRKDKRIV